MLVPFAIEALAISGEAHWSARDLRSHQMSFIKAWQRIGMLVHDGDFLGNCGIRASMERAAEGYVQGGIWREFVLKAPSIAGGQNWAGELREESIPGLSAVARLCVTTDAKFDGFAQAALLQNLELQPLSNATNSEAFAQAERRANSHIQAGERITDVWASRFHALSAAKNSEVKNVSVVDLYAVKRQMFGGSDEILNLMTLLSSSAESRKNLTIFSDWPYEPGAGVNGRDRKLPEDEIRQYFSGLRAALPNGYIGSLSLRLFQRADDRKRNRFVAFGNNYVWDLGHGLEPFSSDLVEMICPATLKTWGNARTYGDIVNDLTTQIALTEIWR